MPRFPLPRFPLAIVGTFFVVVSCCGCGVDKYEERLNESRKLFAEINEMEANLGREWSDKGVQIRMPRKFEPLPPPEVETDEEGNVTYSGPDPRQPHFSDEPLPGLIGAWKAEVGADVDGEPKDLPAYIYLLSNHFLWAGGDPGAAAGFHTLVLETVVNGIGLPSPEPTDWKAESFPPRPGMITQKTSQVWRSKTSRIIDETPGDVSLHLLENGNMKIALIVVVPDTIDPSEKLPQRMELALQTIRIDKQEPGIGDGATGSQPSTGGF
jgi:hypothetical protein